jgi:hypothetical protein
MSSRGTEQVQKMSLEFGPGHQTSLVHQDLATEKMLTGHVWSRGRICPKNSLKSRESIRPIRLEGTWPLEIRLVGRVWS